MSTHVAPPTFLTSFVGRAEELADLEEALGAARIVTVAGPGGVGKTRLAAKAAERAVDRWPDGVCWIDLAEATVEAAVPELLAETLGVVRSSHHEDAQAVARQVAGRHMLVVLDNCEHVLSAAAEVADAVVRSTPGINVLATSREPLGVPGELVWRVPPMRTDDAVTLFRARAGRLTETSAASVRRACSRLDGIPLGIELAAAWSGTLTPQEIVAGLEDRFRLLIRGPHGVAARHQTLAASMDWSYDLLSDADRALLRHVSVCRGGFTVAAARGLSTASTDVVDGLRRLVEKSLLIADTSGEAARYRMLESVREYAAVRLAEAGESDQARDHHLATFLAIAESARGLRDEDKDAWCAVIEADYSNFHTAIEWGLTRGDRGRELAAELSWFWHISRRGDDGLTLLRRAVELGNGERTALQARLLAGVALVADTTSPQATDYDPAQAALEIAEEVGDLDTACLAQLLIGIGKLAWDQDGAWQSGVAAQATAETIGDAFAHDAAIALRGIICHLRDEHEQAIVLLQQAADGLLSRGNRGVGSTAMAFLALSVAFTGDLRRARVIAGEGVEAADPLHDFHRVGLARAVSATVAGMAGLLEEAWQALDPILRLVEDAEPRPYIPWLTEAVGGLHLADGQPELALETYAAEQQLLSPWGQIGMARALLSTGDREAARAQANMVEQRVREMRVPRFVADSLELQAELADDQVRAEQLHHDALALRFEHGLKPACVDSLTHLAELARLAESPVEASRLLGACARARQEIGLPSGRVDAPDDEAFAEGQRMTLEEAAGYVRRARGKRGRPTTGWGSLTATELSVVDLAAEGLSNPEIGQRLFMSRATVKTHLSHVYAKLGIANRTELAARARERG